jgi:hypothetical protein
MVSCHQRNAALALRADFLLIMPGLDPGIHRLQESWIAGSSPAMTVITPEVMNHGDP